MYGKYVNFNQGCTLDADVDTHFYFNIFVNIECMI